MWSRAAHAGRLDRPDSHMCDPVQGRMRPCRRAACGSSRRRACAPPPVGACADRTQSASSQHGSRCACMRPRKTSQAVLTLLSRFGRRALAAGCGPELTNRGWRVRLPPGRYTLQAREFRGAVSSAATSVRKRPAQRGSFAFPARQAILPGMRDEATFRVKTRPGGDAQGRGDHGRRHARAGDRRRGGRRGRGDGARARARRHPPRRRRGADVRPGDDRGHPGGGRASP